MLSQGTSPLREQRRSCRKCGCGHRDGRNQTTEPSEGGRAGRQPSHPPGLLKRAIGVVHRKYHRGSLAVAYIGIRRGGAFDIWSKKGLYVGPQVYGPIVEFGNHNGTVKAQPFMRPAFDAKRGAVKAAQERAMRESVRAQMDKEAKRAIAKMAKAMR